MKKSFKVLIPITLVLLVAILIFPDIVKKEYATLGKTEDSLETAKENIEENKKDNSEEEKEDKLLEKYTLDNLNMRKGPSTDHEKILTIPLGKKVLIVEHKDGWDKIIYNEETGFVSNKYLTESHEEAKKLLGDKNKDNKSEEAVPTMKIVKNILIVNKEYGLPADYNPGENHEAVSQLKKMFKAAKEEIGKDMQSVSGFRSYEYQKGLYERYVKRDGEEKAAMYSAKAGHSEHQTGLAFDIGGNNQNHWVRDSFADTEEAKWLKDNAHRFGFILRYPKDKTHITGYKYEPWHFRYIGKEEAVKVYESGLTLEEYLL